MRRWDEEEKKRERSEGGGPKVWGKHWKILGWKASLHKVTNSNIIGGAFCVAETWLASLLMAEMAPAKGEGVAKFLTTQLRI